MSTSTDGTDMDKAFAPRGANTTRRTAAFTGCMAALAMTAVLVGARSVPGVDVALEDNQPEIARGMFLVAAPELQDPNFNRTVVLITHHGAGGTVGVVINRPTRVPLARALPDTNALAGRSELVFVGGPVLPQTLVLLVRASAPVPSSRHVFGDVYFISNLEVLSRLLADGDGPKVAFRAYAGYAGWARGQLDAEIEQGGWRLVRADAATVFDRDPEHIWDAMIKRASEIVI
jgi:putative transcriptional regulator